MTSTPPLTFFAVPTTPEKMVTLVCASCRMALYMSERELQMPAWQCPSCNAITRA
jgi:predicted RNA-binding Zn-ribbon protein involved in translation (DUF1610 family)